MQILDCTLRDGGYYTHWDFNAQVVDAYISAMNELPIDCLELGYRNNPQKEYNGKFGYCPLSVLKYIRENSKQKLAVMLNEKSTKQEDLEKLVAPLVGVIDMIRLAVDPENLERAVVLAGKVKEYGFEVAFNVMYMSKWNQYEGLYEKLPCLNGIVDVFNMVDSYGSVTPEEVKQIIAKVRQHLTCKIGFHGHNNLQLGLVNTLTAIECDVDSVDATILGMGRGAGNLNMELLLTYLNKHAGLKVNFNKLGDAILAFMPLYEKYRWGTSLPYMISGANSFPQKEVMEWVSNRVYSFNSIVRALDNRMDKKVDNAKYPVLKVTKKYKQVIVVGGGNTVIEHIEAIHEYLNKNPETAIVLSTARHANLFLNRKEPIFYCLVGNEGHRLTNNVGKVKYAGTCVLPPYPRTMGTEVPEFAEASTFELDEISFIDEYKDSVTAIAIQLSLKLTDGEVYLVGYDGYSGNVLSEKEVSLTHENNEIFISYAHTHGTQLKSLTPSIYHTLNVTSIYQLID
ncbi:MAG: aldolase catalytic domain-containing protein [Bacteroidaceae bacterium]|nr:aldolase catalytic domain-containing protein [Bacteroidaceae bacterium]